MGVNTQNMISQWVGLKDDERNPKTNTNHSKLIGNIIGELFVMSMLTYYTQFQQSHSTPDLLSLLLLTAVLE